MIYFRLYNEKTLVSGKMSLWAAEVSGLICGWRLRLFCLIAWKPRLNRGKKWIGTRISFFVCVCVCASWAAVLLCLMTAMGFLLSAACCVSSECVGMSVYMCWEWQKKKTHLSSKVCSLCLTEVFCNVRPATLPSVRYTSFHLPLI